MIRLNINILLEEFDNLSDSQSIIISFKEFNPFIVDNSDIIRVDDDTIQIKSTAGNVVLNTDEINGFQVLEKSDVIKKILSTLCGD